MATALFFSRPPFFSPHDLVSNTQPGERVVLCAVEGLYGFNQQVEAGQPANAFLGHLQQQFFLFFFSIKVLNKS